MTSRKPSSDADRRASGRAAAALPPSRLLRGLRSAAWGLVLVATPVVAAPQAAVPDDFSIALAVSARPARADSVETVTLGASGRAVLGARRGPDGPQPEVELQLPRDAVERVFRAVERQRFFELEPLYRDDDVADGELVSLRVVAAGRSHEVVAINLGVAALDEVVGALLEEIPEDRWPVYRSLYDDSIRRVER